MARKVRTTSYLLALLHGLKSRGQIIFVILFSYLKGTSHSLEMSKLMLVFLHAITGIINNHGTSVQSVDIYWVIFGGAVCVVCFTVFLKTKFGGFVQFRICTLLIERGLISSSCILWAENRRWSLETLATFSMNLKNSLIIFFKHSFQAESLSRGLHESLEEFTRNCTSMLFFAPSNNQ